MIWGPYAQEEKNVLKNTLLYVRLQRRHRPKAGDQSQRSLPYPRIYRTATHYMRIIYLL